MHISSNLLYTQQEIRQLEALAIKNGISAVSLMQRAGTAAFEEILRRWSDVGSIVVFCGSGNNGGDGYIVAKLASENGMDVRVRYLGNLKKLKGEALLAMQDCRNVNVEIKPFVEDELLEAEVFVDAILGIGLQGEVKEDAVKAINYINRDELVGVISLDVPSGIHADTGDVLGAAVFADCTLTFIGMKRGLLTGYAPNCCGDIICNDLGISQDCFVQINSAAAMIELDDYAECLGPRARTANKGNFGHVLIIGGDHGMSGAPRMAGCGALRAGAGCVTIATRPENVATMNIAYPELMCYGVERKKDLPPLLKKATVVVIGPGLGKSKWAQDLLAVVLASDLPLVVDADALNLLAKKSRSRENWVLTPHPGEAARLLMTNNKTIQADRFAAIKKLQEQYGGVCVLKGAGSLVLGESEVVEVCIDGNPGMASGGMGDILSGIIAGLIAQGISINVAANCGVCLHAQAADWAALEFGERGMLATDLLPYLRKLVNECGID